MHKWLSFFLFVLFIFFVSCKQKNKKEEIEKILTEWIGKEIFFPENLPCHISGNDTPQYLCKESLLKQFKILLYVDSTGCSDCRLRLFEWKHLMEEASSLFQDKVGILFYFQPKNVAEIRHLFIRNQFDYPVFIDTLGIVDSINKFPLETQYHCFLLDKNNKVLMVGNPVTNPRIWELYKSQIGELNN